jgi:hypothetical protein
VLVRLGVGWEVFVCVGVLVSVGVLVKVGVLVGIEVCAEDDPQI